MIDEKKIQEAASMASIKDTEKGRNKEDYVISALADHENGFREGYIEGAHWAINEFLEDLWHDASKEPKVSKWIVTRFFNDDNDLVYEVDLNVNIRDWKTYVQQYRIVKWLYIDDLLKGGKK